MRVNGDLALFQAFGALLLEWGAVDRDFVEKHTHGFVEYADHLAQLDWAEVERATGLERAR